MVKLFIQNKTEHPLILNNKSANYDFLDPIIYTSHYYEYVGEFISIDKNSHGITYKIGNTIAKLGISTDYSDSYMISINYMSDFNYRGDSCVYEDYMYKVFSSCGNTENSQIRISLSMELHNVELLKNM